VHDTAYKTAKAFFDLYWTPEVGTIVEVGSLEVNGSLRDAKPREADYIGLDIENGSGVDRIIEIGKPLPFETGSVGCVVASSVLEHDKFFWNSFVEMCRIVKPGGLIYLSVPSNGDVHRYPIDCWRFYPDAGIVLAEWATEKKFPVVLVESFVVNRLTDQWNDFVAVFERDKSSSRGKERMIHRQVACTNIHSTGAKDLEAVSTRTEDALLLSRAESKLARISSARDSADASVHDVSLLKPNLERLETKVDQIVHLQHFLGSVLDREFPVLRGMNAKSDQNVADLSKHLVEAESVHTQALQTLRATAEGAVSIDLFSRRASELEEKIGGLSENLATTLARAGDDITQIRNDLLTYQQQVAKYKERVDLDRAEIERLVSMHNSTRAEMDSVRRSHATLENQLNERTLLHVSVTTELEVAKENLAERALEISTLRNTLLRLSALEAENAELNRTVKYLTRSWKQRLFGVAPAAKD
jgi:SAM-dependent methyltransferase